MGLEETQGLQHESGGCGRTHGLRNTTTQVGVATYFSRVLEQKNAIMLSNQFTRPARAVVVYSQV